MTLGHHVRRRSIAAGSALGLAGSAAAVLGAAGSASAAATLSYDCTVPVLGAQTFTMSMDTAAPSTLPTGGSTTPTWTAVMTIPSGLADTMRTLLSTDLISGEVLSHSTVDGAVSPVTLAIPQTDIGDTGSAQLTGTGTGAAIPAGSPGHVIKLAAGNQDVTMRLVDSSGDPSGSVFVIPCTPAVGQDLTVDSIEVVKAASGTATTAKYNARRDKVAATAIVSPETLVPADGKVTFILKRGKRTVGTTTKPLVNGRARASFRKVRRAGNYTLIANYQGSPLVQASTGKGAFRVR
jgi:hypothetical protein